MSDFCSPDNPYNPKARDARDAERSRRRLEAQSEQDETETESRIHEPRDWTPKPITSNYPQELIELATGEDSLRRYDVLYRETVRERLAAAGLANSRLGITDWERDLKEIQVAERKAERLEFNRARKYGERDERN